LIIGGAFDFTNHTAAGIIEDDINAFKGFFGFNGKRTFDFIRFCDVKFGNEELVGQVLGLSISGFRRVATTLSPCARAASVMVSPKPEDAPRII
jgi:hypothetical protein